MSSPEENVEQFPAIAEGAVFANRTELRMSGLHLPLQSGIAGTGITGAKSIVVSGGYEDDVDYGDVILYTGHGGRDEDTEKQIADQSWRSPGNAALVTSSLSGATVRVVRGRNRASPYAPKSGYRYDGLFRVESFWSERGQSGFLVCRYRLVSESVYAKALDPETNLDDPSQPSGNRQPHRTTVSVQRLVRSSAIVEHVKTLYDFTCQICGTRLSVGANRGYAEGAHIRPLGSPHDGPDEVDNILCLCPNCHVLFDNGAIRIDEDLVMHGGPRSGGKLFVRKNHQIAAAHVNYHYSTHVSY